MRIIVAMLVIGAVAWIGVSSWVIWSIINNPCVKASMLLAAIPMLIGGHAFFLGAFKLYVCEKGKE